METRNKYMCKNDLFLASVCLQVRRSVTNTVQRLQREIPGIRIAVIAHGDYCDASTYVTKIVDFTTDGKKLCDFVQKVQGTGKLLASLRLGKD